MKSVLRILVIVLVLAVLPVFGGPVTQETLHGKGVLVREVPDGRMLCVINGNQDDPGPRWFVLGGFHQNRELASATSAFLTVHEMEPSADGRLLAVVSAAEGATILEVIDLPRLLDAGEWSVLCEVNPFPGQVSINSWRGGHLEVTSNVPLFLLDRKLPELQALLLPDHVPFLLNPVTGAMAGVSLTLPRLIRGLKIDLGSPLPAERQDAVRGLAALRQPDLIGCLRSALKTEKVKEVRQTIREALRSLKSVESASGGK